MKTHFRFLFIILTYFCVSAQEQSNIDFTLKQDSVSKENFEIKFFTLEDGLSQVTSNDLIQDRNGFVWIATADGLNRFDGKDFKHFKHKASDSISVSSNDITKLLEDETGNIWVGTNGNGLNYYDHHLDIFHRIKLKNSQNENEIISAIVKDKDGIIWVASQTSGLHSLQLLEDGSYSQKNYFSNQNLSGLLVDDNNNLWVGNFTGQISRIDLNNKTSFESNLNISAKGNIQAFYKTKNHLLIGSDTGFFTYNLQSNSFKQLELESQKEIETKHVIAFLKASDSSVWIGTGNGLFLFNWKDESVLKRIVYSNDSLGLSNNTVHSLLRLSANQILVGTANYLNLIDFKTPYFNNISKDKKGNHLLNDNVVFSIFKDGNDVWIGTSDGGLNLIRNNKPFYFKAKTNTTETLNGAVVRSIVKDKKNARLWLATTRGLSLINLKTFNPNKPVFKTFRHNPENPNSINMDFIKDIALDKNNNLWGATFGHGIFRVELNNNHTSIIRYKNDKYNANSLRNDVTQCIRVDKKNNIWIGTKGGLSQLKFDDSNYSNPEFTNYFKIAGKKNTLSHNTVYDILFDTQERLWLGTRNGINLFLGENNFKSWTTQEQFPNAIVYSIQDDLSNNLWLGTNDGMVKFNPEHSDFTHYSNEDNLQSKEFNIHAKHRDSHGNIYLGGIGGVTFFNPKELEKIDASKDLYFSELRVRDSIVKPNITGKNILSQSIANTKTLTFNHKQFPFYLEFSSIDFRLHKNVEFAYKLLPTDSDWNTLKDPEIQFLNLAPGQYTLQLNGFSRGKEWNQAPLEMNILIKSPWWSTNLAYLIYTAILILLGYSIYRFQLSRKIADSESKRLKEVNELKNTLFTNITHEFRTPLTVIKGMTDSIKSNLKNNEYKNLESSLELIERNSDSLLHLVNEMLDLSQIESGNMELQLIQSDVIPFLKYLSESFSSYAEENQVSLTIYSETDSLIMDFDGNKLTSIVSNLLSNAIKFTPEFGKIIVHINKVNYNEAPSLFIKVKDNGVGIPNEELPNIFNRFYQSDTTTIRKHEGTGIGLAITKELTELMNGNIDVKSTLKKGSEFSIMIPITNNAPLSATTPIDTIPIRPQINISSKQIEEKIKSESKLPLVLIIEDNMDVAHYLKLCLKNKYETLHAIHGDEGIEMALEKIPDIVISDVMMPKKDGFEVCKTLKTDERTDHIPIIILTAKVTTEDRLTGLSHGADAYLAKPFNKEELFTRLDQLVSLRKKLINKIQGDGIKTILKKDTKDPKLLFLQKIQNIINEDISNSNFGSSDLAEKLLISESQLYRKIKAITEKSTAVFIRSVRLQFAKELLATTDKTVSEVAYDSGFNNPSWFSRAFKKEFGFSPSTTSK